MPIVQFKAAISAGLAEIEKGSRVNTLDNLMKSSILLRNKLNEATNELKGLSDEEKKSAENMSAMLAKAQINFVESKIGLVKDVNALVLLSATLPSGSETKFLSNHQDFIQTPAHLERVLQAIITLPERREFINSEKNLDLVAQSVTNIHGASKEQLNDKLDSAARLLASVPDAAMRKDYVNLAVASTLETLGEVEQGAFISPVIQLLNRLPPDIRGLESDGIRAGFAIGLSSKLHDDKDVSAVIQLLSPTNHLQFLDNVKDLFKSREAVDSLTSRMSEPSAAQFENMMKEYNPQMMALRTIVEIEAVPDDTNTMVEEVGIESPVIESQVHVAQVIEMANSYLDDIDIELEETDYNTVEVAAPDVEIKTESKAENTQTPPGSAQQLEAESEKINEISRRQ